MDRRVFAALLALLVVFAPALYSVPGAPPVYQVEDLGTTADGLVPTVTGINASGQVSGYVSTPAGLRAVRYTNGLGWTYLPGLQSMFSVATAINVNGDLAGYYLPPAGLRPFRYVDSIGVTMINVLPGGTFALGQAIGADGEVVGYGNSSAGQRAWRTGPGLGVLPFVPPALSAGTSAACGVNAAGQLVGTFTANGVEHAYRLEPGGSLTDVGTLGGTTSSGCALDADGRVGGQSRIGTSNHAFLFSTAIKDIDVFNSSVSRVEAIANGVAVGTFTSPLNAVNPHAFVYTDAGGTVDLNTRVPSDSGWVLSSASAVSATGQIVGQGLRGGVARAYRLTPGAAADTTAPVITSVTASPSTIWPPKGQMVTVTTSAVATDNSGEAPVCTLENITSGGAATPDATVTGPNTGSVKAVGGRTYTFKEKCVDGSGNEARSPVDVTVLADVTAPVIATLTAAPSSITPPNGAMVPVAVAVSATDNVDDAPSCGLSSILSPGAPATDAVIAGPFSASVRAVGGRTYSLTVTCTDAAGNAAARSVDVVVPPDTTPPVIASLTATPSVVWPPNDELVLVVVAVSASDDSEATPSCALSGVTATGGTAGDYSVTGQYSAKVRAVGGRTYSLRVTCSDAAGNRRESSANVFITPDTTAPVITALSASPDHIWPPNNKLEPVTLSVAATDDVDAAPACSLLSITGAPAADAVITGPLTASVRSEKGVVYTFNVGCADKAGNKSRAAIQVAVTKDPPPASATKANKR